MHGLLAPGLGGQVRVSGQCHAAVRSTVSQAAPNDSLVWLTPLTNHLASDSTLVELDRRIQKLESEGRADADTPRSAGADVAPPAGNSLLYLT